MGKMRKLKRGLDPYRVARSQAVAADWAEKNHDHFNGRRSQRNEEMQIKPLVKSS